MEWLSTAEVYPWADDLKLMISPMETEFIC